MTRITPNPTAEKLQIKSQFKNENFTFRDVRSAASSKEQDFAEIHALFEIQYKQFLTDTSDEIAKRAQRVLELESIVYGNTASK